MSFRGRKLRGEEVSVPPGLVGYVMVMEEKHDFSEGSENNEEQGEQELVESPEALERDFVSKGGQGWKGVRASARPRAEPSPFPRTALSEPLPVSAASPCGAWRPSLAQMPKCAGP